MTALTATTVQGLPLARSPAATRKRSRERGVSDSPTTAPGFMRIGTAASSAGSSTTERTSATITPTGAKMPRSAMGARATVAKESSPPAVVRLVNATGSPECSIAPTIASSLVLPDESAR